MEKLPPEICSEIFKYACLDTGYTGRSLSLVSKYIHNASRLIKFQSIALRGHDQILAFASILKQPASYPYRRPVRYLFIFYKNQSTADSGVSTLEYVKITEAVQSILENTALDLELLELLASYNPYNIPIPFDIAGPPIFLPRLKELSTHDTFLFWQKDQRNNLNFASCPKLCHLHIVLQSTETSDLPVRIRRLAPSLTHLRFSNNLHHYPFVTRLKDMLGIHEKDVKPNPEYRLPSLEWMEVKPPPPPIVRGCGTPRAQYNGYMEYLRSLHRLDSRFVLLKAQDRTQEAPDELDDWLNRVNGGTGCWSMKDEAAY